MQIVPLVLAVAIVPGCAVGVPDEDDPVESLDDLKLDGAYSVTDMGPITGNGESRAELGPNDYHLWTLWLPDPQPTVQLWTRGIGAEIETDTIMYLFERQPDATWGSYVDKNDDGEWSAPSGEMPDLDLAPYSYLKVSLRPGEYAVLVKGKKTTTTGAYNVTYDCNHGQSCP
jgi:hypothetical protein